MDPTTPEHYRAHPSGVECIEVVEHMGFLLGNVIKYIWRADHKDDPLADLRKARWYLDREITRREAAAQPVRRCSAHGEQDCSRCSQTKPGGLTDDGRCRDGCTYDDTGLHWDTCAQRVRRPKSSA